jgi:hypothetical protein
MALSSHCFLIVYMYSKVAPVTIASNPLSAIIIDMAKQTSKSTKRSPKSYERTEKRLTFREATRLALDLYHETFRDLARYDREEKPLDTIPY